MSFSKMKRNRGQISKLVEAAKSASGSGPKNYSDERIWKPTVDKAGNGYAVFRFLPAKDDAKSPWIQYWDHGFQGPGGQWYIEKSLTSLQQDDPVSELNSRLWNSGIDEDKETARKQKRRLHYVANIYMINDSSNPENNGKVFLYQFGAKIFAKIMDAMDPEFDDEDPINPFDFWEGANFKLKIRNVEGWRNYDKSEFESSSALSEDDEELEKIYEQIYDLSEFLDPANYKTYDELKKRLNTVLGISEIHNPMEDVSSEPAPKMKEAEASTPDEVDVNDDVSADDDDDLAFFKKLAEED